MTESPHPDTTLLLDLLDGRLSDAEASRVRTRVDADTSWHEQLDELRTVVAGIESGPLPTVPAAIRRRAHGLLWKRRAHQLWAGVDELVARIVRPAVQPSPALRAAGDDAKRYLWEAGDLEIYATAARGDTGWELSGECYSVDGDDVFSGELLDGEEAHAGHADEDGGHWSGLASGTYRLRFSAGDTVVHTPPFVLA